MIKKAILTLIFIIPLITIAQSSEPWQLGLNASPFYFGRYNAKVISEKDKQNLPNGYSFGLTVENNWNRNWGVYAGLEYSFQSSRHIEYINIGSGSAVNSDFEYLKLPLMLQYSTQLSASNDLFLVFSQGVQVLRLTDYYTIKDDYSRTVIYTSGERHFYEKSRGLVHEMQNQAYQKYVFGVIGAIGLKKYFSTNFSYSLHLRYEFDITDADKDLFYSSYNHTHNYRIGFVLGIQYHLSKE